MKKIILSLLTLGVLFTSCENSGWDFPDFGKTSVYFATQTPVRTITLGDDAYDTTLDNEHKCKIMATMGGVYENKVNRIIDFVVDESLCTGLSYEDGSAVLPMPTSYYTLASNKITIPKGKVLGGVEVQLTDAFFNDPKSVKTTYVIPLKMTDVQNADTILESKAHILYALKYKNKWHGYWLSRGKDVIDDNGTVTTVERKAEFIERDEVRSLATTAYKQVVYPVSTVVKVFIGGVEGTETLHCDLILTFDDSDNCTITTNTPGCTATGNGKWVYQGAKKAWGDKDRDELTLKYELTYTYQQHRPDGPTVYKKYTCDDILVARDRGSKLESFTVKSN
ncbi:DUF5627 domain-containing protein [Bacteroides sp. OttesenSCG-928-J23]|nr:DUF5627 domain-containing protein [Bacteroides sp. OttesenSCG-928-J23]MDL2304732.1 DUF5627 domain-containing protein [Bacteroides sp. OttesenSCG-928-D19]